MLITSLLPMLERYSLGLDLTAGADGVVTVTIMPRKAPGAKHDPKAAEVRPIAITATAAEIDAELAKGDAGALGQMLAERKSLADQIAEQLAAAQHAKTAAAKPAAGKKAEPAKASADPKFSPVTDSKGNPVGPNANPPQPAPAAPAANEPASLWG